MYDYNNGRFLSVDPFIQGFGTQSTNPYTYILNNPLAGTDPTGYFIQGVIGRGIVTALGHVGRKIGTEVAKFVVSRQAKQAAVVVIVGEGLKHAIRNSDPAEPIPPLPGFAPSDEPEQLPDATDITDLIQDSEGFQQADPIPNIAQGPALDSGISDQGIIMANQESDSSDTKSQDDRPIFVIDENGTPDSIREDLENAGYPGEPTTETQEDGTIHRGVEGKDGPMDVRVMDGQRDPGDFKGPRVTTKRAGTNDPVKPDGSRFRNNESKSERLRGSHIHLNNQRTTGSNILDRHRNSNSNSN